VRKPVLVNTEVSMVRRYLALWLLIGVASLTPSQAQQDVLPVAPDGSSGGPAAAALSADLEVEGTLLGEALVRYQSLSARRGRLLTRLAELYSELDRVVQAVGAVTSLSVEAVLLQIDAAEGERSRMQATERALIESIIKSARRVDLLEDQLAELKGGEEEKEGALSGIWDVVFMPLEHRGRFNLRQSGTLVSGTYRLDGGWSGSLQGTLVNRKVYLVRIDSKLGKSMELEGVLASDGRTIRGTWLNYEMAGGDGSSGQWSATKQ
jgi:hypothetical protein